MVGCTKMKNEYWDLDDAGKSAVKNLQGALASFGWELNFWALKNCSALGPKLAWTTCMYAVGVFLTTQF